MEFKCKEKDLVWAKMRGYPPWPAKVDRKPRGSKVPNNKFYVTFFGLPHEHAWMAGSDLYPYEEYLPKYNVPRKGLPEAVSEAEEYRAKMRSYKSKPASSPEQTGDTPESNTRKRTPGSSERSGRKRIKQEASAEEEPTADQEEESRDNDKQETEDQLESTPVKLESGEEPQGGKSPPTEEPAQPTKRPGRRLKRLSDKKDAPGGKRRSTEAAGGRNEVGEEDTSVGKKEEPASEPTSSITSVDGLHASLSTPCGSQDLLNDQQKATESLSQNCHSSSSYTATKTENQRVSTRRKTQSPATIVHPTSTSASSPATEVLPSASLPPPAKKVCVEEEGAEGNRLAGSAPKPSPERRSSRPRRTPRRLAMEEVDHKQRDTPIKKDDAIGPTNADGCLIGSSQERCDPTVLLATPPEPHLKTAPVRGRKRGPKSTKKERNSIEEVAHTIPDSGVHSVEPKPIEAHEALSGDYSASEVLLNTSHCSLQSATLNLSHSDSENASKVPEHLTAATTVNSEEDAQHLHSSVSQRDQPDKELCQELHSSHTASTDGLLEERVLIGCQQEENSLKEQSEHLHEHPLEVRSASGPVVEPLQMKPTTEVNASPLETQQPTETDGSPLETQQPTETDGSPLEAQQPIEADGSKLVTQQPTETDGSPLEAQQPTETGGLTPLSAVLPTQLPTYHSHADECLPKQSMRECPSTDQLSQEHSMQPSKGGETLLHLEQSSAIHTSVQPSTQPAGDSSTKQALSEHPMQPVKETIIKPALDGPSVQLAVDLSTQQMSVDPPAGEQSIEHLSEGQGISKQSQKCLLGRQLLENLLHKHGNGSLVGTLEGQSMDVQSQEKPTRRRSQKEGSKRASVRRSSRQQSHEEGPSVGHVDVSSGGGPDLNIGVSHCINSTNDCGKEDFHPHNNSNEHLIKSQCQIEVTPPAYTVEQIESGCVITIDTHQLGDKICFTEATPPDEGKPQDEGTGKVNDCAVVSDQTTIKGIPAPGEQGGVSSQSATDQIPVVGQSVHVSDAVSMSTESNVGACDTENVEKKKKKHKQKGSVEPPGSPISQIAIHPGWSPVQCLQVYNYNLKAALVIGSPDIKAALAVMKSIRALKYTAEDLQKVPDLVTTVRKVRRYRDNDKIRKKANEVYSALHVLFAQGDSSSQGSSNTDGEKAIPMDHDRPITWDVIDTNDLAAMKSIKIECEDKPPSPSPRRSQRSSVKNNRVNYSKLLEEDGFDESDDQLVPLS